YGAIAALTERIRLGYGVRLMPKHYNHPVRTAESVAVLDLVSGGRADMGTGRSSTRAALDGFGLDPHEPRVVRQEAIGHVLEHCEQPIGSYVHNQAATFTMTLCADDRDSAVEMARESFEWYPKTGARQIASVATWMAERQQDLGNYGYAADMKKTDDEGSLDL